MNDFKTENGILLKYEGAAEEVRVPDGVTAIGKEAFAETAVRSVTLPEGVLRIDEQAFAVCEKLERVELPESLASIGKYAFYYCKSLASIRVPPGCRIASRAFAECCALADDNGFVIVNGILYGCCGIVREMIVPGGVKRIDDRAFAGDRCVTSVVLPDGLAEIGDLAFQFDSMLERIVLPPSLRTIGKRAFEACRDLRSIALPEGITRLEKAVFSNCISLSEAVLPESLTVIGERAFDSCTELAAIRIPAAVAEIGSLAFFGCGLKEVSAEADTSVMSTAFRCCRHMVRFRAPKMSANRVRTLGLLLPWLFTFLEEPDAYVKPDQGCREEAVRFAEELAEVIFKEDSSRACVNLLEILFTAGKLTKSGFESGFLIPAQAAGAVACVAAMLDWKQSRLSGGDADPFSL